MQWLRGTERARDTGGGGVSRAWAVRLLPATPPSTPSLLPVPATVPLVRLRPAAAPHSSFAAETNREFAVENAAKLSVHVSFIFLQHFPIYTLAILFEIPYAHT